MLLYEMAPSAALFHGLKIEQRPLSGESRPRDPFDLCKKSFHDIYNKWLNKRNNIKTKCHGVQDNESVMGSTALSVWGP